MKKRLESVRAQLSILERFAAKYDNGTVPSEMLTGTLSDFADKPAASVSLIHAPNEAGRIKLLAACGQLFGSDGWTRELDYYKEHFDWKKELDGVTVTIGRAEPVANPMHGTPVMPQAFPILLEDRKESFFFTYGSGHFGAYGQPLNMAYTIIEAASEEEARLRMVEARGLIWATSYRTAEEAGVERHGLHEVSLEDAALPKDEPAPPPFPGVPSDDSAVAGLF